MSKIDREALIALIESRIEELKALKFRSNDVAYSLLTSEISGLTSVKRIIRGMPDA